MIDVRKITAQCLRQGGFDGLYGSRDNCGCLIENLMPCVGSLFSNSPISLCQPGYRVKCDCEDDDHLFHITPLRDEIQEAPEIEIIANKLLPERSIFESWAEDIRTNGQRVDKVYADNSRLRSKVMALEFAIRDALKILDWEYCKTVPRDDNREVFINWWSNICDILDRGMQESTGSSLTEELIRLRTAATNVRYLLAEVERLRAEVERLQTRIIDHGLADSYEF